MMWFIGKKRKRQIDGIDVVKFREGLKEGREEDKVRFGS